jgi:hypothetical protein
MNTSAACCGGGADGVGVADVVGVGLGSRAEGEGCPAIEVPHHTAPKRS